EYKELEIHFDSLLEYANKSALTNAEILNCALSCISSMSPFYKHFHMDLIKKLIETLFSIAIRTHQKRDYNFYDLQNHSSALFIKLIKNCPTLFVQHFQAIQLYVTNLIDKSEISLTQFQFFFDGLFILSNLLPIDEQRTFLLGKFLPRIQPILDYDLDLDGKSFFIDIGLSQEPNLHQNELPLISNETYSNFSNALNLLNRFMKRINSDRFLNILWPKILDYIVPFIKFLGAFHRLFFAFRHNEPNLGRICHHTYQSYIFDELPFNYLSKICNETILPRDRYKTLMKKWDRNSSPSNELIRLHLQNRLWNLYSQSFTQFMFVVLDQKLSESQLEKRRILNDSRPDSNEKRMSDFKLRFDDQIRFNDQLSNLEILNESILHSICTDFILFLTQLFSPTKNVKEILNDNCDVVERGEQMDTCMLEDGDDLNKDEEQVASLNQNYSENQSQANDELNHIDEGLMKFIMDFNPKLLALTVIGLLQWPISNLRVHICQMNQKLIGSLICRNMINSIEAFYELSDQIIVAISKIDPNEAEILNRLGNIFILIYKKYVFESNLTEIVNSRFCAKFGLKLDQWRCFGEAFRNGLGRKKIQKQFRILIEEMISKEEISTLYSKTKPNVLSLGMVETDGNITSSSQSTDNLDIGFLSWL
ncbi:hypothetical protein QR98_0085950, partial [Sarcoptes scabiei]